MVPIGNLPRRTGILQPCRDVLALLIVAAPPLPGGIDPEEFRRAFDEMVVGTGQPPLRGPLAVGDFVGALVELVARAVAAVVVVASAT